MRGLLDTSSFLWFIVNSGKLSNNARSFIADLENELFLSISSLWEIAIKTSIGKLSLTHTFELLMPRQLEENQISTLPIKIGSPFKDSKTAVSSPGPL